MIYWDTSVIIKLYIKEEHSEIVAEKAKEFDQAIPITTLHDLELTNALCLKVFRNEIADKEADFVKTEIQKHEALHLYYRPTLDWADIYQAAFALSEKYTRQIGSKSLDILHVSIAHHIKSDIFFSNNHRQLELADITGLSTKTVVL